MFQVSKAHSEGTVVSVKQKLVHTSWKLDSCLFLCLVCFLAAPRRCRSRQHGVWARAAGWPLPDTGPHPATAAPVWTGNAGAGKSVPVSHESARTPQTSQKALTASSCSALFASFRRSSVDYVAPTPDNFTHTPLIVPSSPTGPENEHGKWLDLL